MGKIILPQGATLINDEQLPDLSKGIKLPTGAILINDADLKGQSGGAQLPTMNFDKEIQGIRDLTTQSQQSERQDVPFAPFTRSVSLNDNGIFDKQKNIQSDLDTRLQSLSDLTGIEKGKLQKTIAENPTLKTIDEIKNYLQPTSTEDLFNTGLNAEQQQQKKEGTLKQPQFDTQGRPIKGVAPKIGKEPNIKDAIDNAVNDVVEKYQITDPNEIKRQRDAITHQYQQKNLIPALDNNGKSVLKKSGNFFDSFNDALTQAHQQSLEDNFLIKAKNQDAIDYLNRVKENPENSIVKERTTVPSGLGNVGDFLGQNAELLMKGTIGGIALGETGLTGGESTGAFTAMAKDLSASGYANGLKKNYFALKEQNPNMSDGEAFEKAQKIALGSEATNLATGAILSKSLPKTTAEPSVNAIFDGIKQSVKAAPKPLIAAAAGSAVNDVVAQTQGVNVTPEQMLDNATEATKQMAVMHFGLSMMPHIITGTLQSIADIPSNLKPQIENVVASAPREEVNNFYKQQEEEGTVPRGTTEKIDEHLDNFNLQKKVVQDLPIDEEQKAVIASRLVNKGEPENISQPIELNPEITNEEEKQAEVIPAKTNEPVTTGNELEPTEKTQPATTKLNQVGKGTSEQENITSSDKDSSVVSGDNKIDVHDNNIPLYQRISKILKDNGFEIENQSSSKSESEYIKVVFRDENGNVDYRKKIRVSGHSNMRSPYADADIRIGTSIEDAVKKISESSYAFKDLKIPEPKKDNSVVDKDFTAKGGNKVVDEKGEPLILYHSTYNDFTDFKDGVNYFAEDADYSKKIATLMNRDGKGANEAETRDVKTIPVNIRAQRVYELPEGQEMNDNLVKHLLKDPDFSKKYDAIKGIDLYSDNKTVYAVLDKSQIKKLPTEKQKDNSVVDYSKNIITPIDKPQKVSIKKIKKEAGITFISQEKVDAIQQSVNNEGVKVPIIVNKANGDIVDGSHRLDAAINAGQKDIPVIYVEGMQRRDGLPETEKLINDLSEKYQSKDNSVLGNENNSIEAEHNNAIEPVSEESTQSKKEQSTISENTEQVAPQEKNENIGEEQKTDGNTIGARHESLNNVADRLGLPPVERGTFLSPEEQLKRGRRLLEGGADPQQVANDFKESGKVSADEISVARAQQEKLAKAADEARKKFGKDSDEFKKAQQEYADWDRNVIKPMGTASGAAFSSLQGETDLDTGSFISVKKSVEDASGNPVSAKQEKKIEQLTNDNAELKKRAEEAERKLIEATNENIGKGNKKTYTEKAKDVANRFRKLKQKPFTFKDENGNDITPQVSGLTWNDLVELGAKAIEKTGEIADGVAAILDKVKDADWYIKLSDKDKTAFEEKLNEHFGASLPITERFADKKDNKFSTEDAKDIWDYAKKNYLDKGTSYRDMIAHVRDDLGLSWRQVNEAISSPKTKPISDAMWKRQADYRKMQNATRNWIDEQNKSVAGKLLRKVSGAFRGIAVYGHGGIFVGTHAGMTLFQPSTWSKTIPAFFRGWKYAYGNEAVYEKAMEELKNRPTYTIAQRAGLKNNPDEINTEEYQKSQTFLGKLGDAGKKGFNAIKVLRQDLFDFHYNKLSATDKINPEVAKSIAQLVNNATGATNLNVPDWINEATFAGAMEASRWGKLLTNPVKANAIAVKAILTPDKVSASDRVFAKVWARRVGEQVATYGSLLLANAAIQGMVNPKNPVNLLHPSQPNWLRFKFGDYTFDPTSGMVSVIDFISSLVSDSIKSKKERHGDTVLQADAKNTFGYLRGKLAPAYGTGVDLKTGTDFSGNTLPYNNDKPQAGRHQLTWLEYATEKLPIPVAESFKVMFQSAVDNGLSKPQASDIFKGIISGAVSGTTGFRVGESTPKPTPFTDQDKQDPIFKYYIDKGLELPNTSPSSEKITDEDNATKKLLSDYPKDVQDKYIQVHKDFLKEELQSIKSNDAVYVKKYKENGKIISEVSLDIPEKGNYQQVKFSKLSNDELVQILHLAQTAATKKTKEQLFSQAQETF